MILTWSACLGCEGGKALLNANETTAGFLWFLVRREATCKPPHLVRELLSEVSCCQGRRLGCLFSEIPSWWDSCQPPSPLIPPPARAPYFHLPCPEFRVWSASPNSDLVAHKPAGRRGGPVAPSPCQPSRLFPSL